MSTNQKDAFEATLAFLNALLTGILRGSTDPAIRVGTAAANGVLGDGDRPALLALHRLVQTAAAEAPAADPREWERARWAASQVATLKKRIEALRRGLVEFVDDGTPADRVFASGVLAADDKAAQS